MSAINDKRLGEMIVERNQLRIIDREGQKIEKKPSIMAEKFYNALMTKAYRENSTHTA